jgi:hypothetical protein
MDPILIDCSGAVLLASLLDPLVWVEIGGVGMGLTVVG